ncbi:MAG: hypothetical protein IKH36_02055 [Bacilli bacterium]|nr:hypothetical protein [Bacilli bacterium]
MKRIHKIAKLHLMEMAPIEAIEILDKYKIPTPYRELLEIICIKRVKGFRILDELEKQYNIKMNYYTMIINFDIALDMFYKSNQYFSKKE